MGKKSIPISIFLYNWLKKWKPLGMTVDDFAEHIIRLKYKDDILKEKARILEELEDLEKKHIG